MAPCRFSAGFADYRRRLRRSYALGSNALSTSATSSAGRRQDYLRDGIYELRASSRGVQYRILYYFHGRSTALLSHGLIKEAIVPPGEIDRAVRRRKAFRTDPEAHANLEEIE